MQSNRKSQIGNRKSLNSLGQRAEKNVGGSLTEYFYNAFGQVVYTSNGTTVLEDFFPVGASGFNFAKRQASGARFLHANALGTVGVVTDYAGATLQDEIYYPWGQRWSVVGSTVWGERFASLQERDAETVTWQDPLDPTPNRTYTSGLGRWLSPDPLGGDVTNPQSLNRYAYVLNNPANLIDPLGLQNPCQEEGVVGVGCPSIDPDFLPPGGCATIIADGSPVGNTCDKPGFTADSSSFGVSGGGGGGGKPGSTKPDKPKADPVAVEVATQGCEEQGQLAFNIPFTKIPVTMSASFTVFNVNFSLNRDVSVVIPTAPIPSPFSFGLSADVNIDAPPGFAPTVNIGEGKNLGVGTFLTPNGPQGFTFSVGPSFGPVVSVSEPVGNLCGKSGG